MELRRFRVTFYPKYQAYVTRVKASEIYAAPDLEEALALAADDALEKGRILLRIEEV